MRIRKLSTENPASGSKKFLLPTVLVIIIATALAAYYFAPSGASTTSNFTVVEKLTVYGKVAGYPCAALKLPCPYPTNQTSIAADLTSFRGRYYYVSNITVNDVVYTVWFDNSTYYCVSPKFQNVNTCPP